MMEGKLKNRNYDFMGIFGLTFLQSENALFTMVLEFLCKNYTPFEGVGGEVFLKNGFLTVENKGFKIGTVRMKLRK